MFKLPPFNRRIVLKKTTDEAMICVDFPLCSCQLNIMTRISRFLVDPNVIYVCESKIWKRWELDSQLKNWMMVNYQPCDRLEDKFLRVAGIGTIEQ